jgi:hypothetical protein
MYTPEEHIQEYKRTRQFPVVLWCHALDVLKHCLTGDTNNTFFRDPHASDHNLAALSRRLDGLPKESESLMEARFNCETQERKWRRFDCEYGDLVTERLLDGDERPFDDYRKVNIPKPATTLIIDMSVNSCDRGGNQMAERHKQVYNYAVKANQEGRACRVVAVAKINQSENTEKLAFVLKDYDDPIFPAIWAALESNASTNDFLNVVQDYFIGTKSAGNGSCVSYNVFEDFSDSEVILIEPHSYVKYNPM